MIGRFPITHISVANALGSDTDEVRDALLAGRSGLRKEAVGTQTSWVGRVGKLPELPHSMAIYDARQARLALASMSDLLDGLHVAIDRWGAERVGLVLGTTTGGMDTLERLYAEHEGHIPAARGLAHRHPFHVVPELIALQTGLSGPRYVVSTACTSSAKALASAARMLDLGFADACLVGGVDSLCDFTLRGFASLKILSAHRCRPFSAGRDGINLGEGGAWLLMERSGVARATVRGVGETTDAYHMTAPHPEAEGASSAISRALIEAEVEACDIAFINAHGTGTLHNDASEALALRRVFGQVPPVVSTKPLTGHQLGAAGATEAVFTILCLEAQQIPGTLGAEPLDELLGIPVSESAQRVAGRLALSNSFGFGGSNAAVVLEVPA